MKTNSYYEQTEKWRKDTNNWKFGIFYYNPEDPSIFPPKRIRQMGMTINFANPKSYWFLVGMAAFFGFIIYMVTINLKIT